MKATCSNISTLNHIPAGQNLNVAVSFDSTQWSDLSVFPCPKSKYAEDANACDYEVFGWQTVPGNPNKV